MLTDSEALKIILTVQDYYSNGYIEKFDNSILFTYNDSIYNEDGFIYYSILVGKTISSKFYANLYSRIDGRNSAYYNVHRNEGFDIDKLDDVIHDFYPLHDKIVYMTRDCNKCKIENGEEVKLS